MDSESGKVSGSICDVKYRNVRCLAICIFGGMIYWPLTNIS